MATKKNWLPIMWWLKIFGHHRVGEWNWFSITNCNEGSPSMTKDFSNFVLMETSRQTPMWCPTQNGCVMSVLTTLVPCHLIAIFNIPNIYPPWALFSYWFHCPHCHHVVINMFSWGCPIAIRYFSIILAICSTIYCNFYCPY